MDQMGTRDRMIDAAVAGLQRRGAEGTSFTEILDASGAARGAIYHHFPGGKAELLAEAARRNGEQVVAALESLPTDTTAALAEAFLDAVRPTMAAAAAGCGCAVAAVTVGTVDPLREVATGALDSWTRTLAGRFTDAGMSEEAALDRASLMIAVLEGAQVLCRAAGSMEPFERVAQDLLTTEK